MPQQLSARQRPPSQRHAPALLPQLAIELGPLLLFFAANAAAGIYAGTGVFMVATLSRACGGLSLL